MKVRSVPETTIYIVDDDVAVADALDAVLRSVDYRTKIFHSGREFLDATVPEDEGCVILDVRMPGMTGLELQKEINHRGMQLPVILLTGHGDIRMAVEAMRAGAVDFLEKPYHDEELLAAVLRGLEHHADRSGPGSTDPALLDRLERLTQREREVFKKLAAGLSNKMIARELDISPRTVEVYRARVMEKLECQSLAHLVRTAIAANADI